MHREIKWRNYISSFIAIEDAINVTTVRKTLQHRKFLCLFAYISMLRALLRDLC